MSKIIEIEMIFRGEKGFGFEQGKKYLLTTWIANNLIWINDGKGQQIPYSSVARFLDNWREAGAVIITAHDEDCPSCGFPETLIILDAKTMRPLMAKCSKRCGWEKDL